MRRHSSAKPSDRARGVGLAGVDVEHHGAAELLDDLSGGYDEVLVELSGQNRLGRRAVAWLGQGLHPDLMGFECKFGEKLGSGLSRQGIVRKGSGQDSHVGLVCPH